MLVAVTTLAGLLIAVTAWSQQRRGPRRGAGRQMVTQPYKGIIANGERQTGLFKIESTGVSTEPVRRAAEAFLAGLTDEQRARTTYPVDDIEWRLWDNRHFYRRQGVGFNEMSEAQRDLAFGLLQASLSARGLKKSKDIMKLNGTLAELANNFDEYGEWLYWITVMGEPSATQPWGWQIDGHHLIINYFVLGDQVVMSPVFMGSEPIEAKGGRFQGTIVMQDEQNKGLEFVQSLTAKQQGEAILNRNKTSNNNLSEAYRDNLDLNYAGLKCADLTADQSDKLLALIEEYVGNMQDGHARVKMAEVESRLSETWFAWIGGTDVDSVYYYRIHSPVVLIEFDHQRRVAPFRSREPTREHIHTVVRTPNGNDYGKDLLRQHHLSHPH